MFGVHRDDRDWVGKTWKVGAQKDAPQQPAKAGAGAAAVDADAGAASSSSTVRHDDVAGAPGGRERRKRGLLILGG